MTTRTSSRLLRPATTVLLGALLLAACGGTSSGAPPGTRGPTSTPSTPAPRQKPPLLGLLDMGVQTSYQRGQPFPPTDPSGLDAYAGAFGGIVVNEAWSQLEPTAGSEQWGPLDQSLAAVSSWNASHPTTPLGVKLRIFAGRSAPGWVTAESGTVTIVVHGRPVTVGRWWTPPFEAAWHAFQQALAARYDPDPLVRQVSVSSCSSSTGEPFVVSGARTSQANLAAAGWSIGAQEQCLDGALSDYSGWKRTPITFAFNPLPTPTGPDTTLMDQVMQECAASAAHDGPQCIVGNNDLSPTVATSAYSGPTIAQIQRLEAGVDPPTVYFQTSGSRLTCQTISTGLGYHARSIEIWPPDGNYRGFAVQRAATLTQWNRALISGTSLSC